MNGAKVDGRYIPNVTLNIPVSIDALPYEFTMQLDLGSEVNSNFAETCPSITPDGKYLFFGRYNEERELSNLYWVSTEVIEKLRPKQ